MSSVIQIEPLSPFENPTSIAWSGSHTIALGSRYLIRATAGNSVSTITVPAQRTHRIQNEGAYPFAVASTGNANVSVTPGSEVQVSWDDLQSKHEVQLTKNDPTTIKTITLHTYVVTTSDVLTGGAVILTPNTASAVMVWTGGILVGPLDAIFTPATSVLSWSGLGMEATVEAAEVLQILAIGV